MSFFEYAVKDRLGSENKLKDGVMEQALKGKPLTKRQKQKNRIISTKRYVVERGFGAMKRILKFRQASYIGISKVKAEAFRKATCFNLLKAVNKIRVNDWFPRKWCVQLQLI